MGYTESITKYPTPHSAANEVFSLISIQPKKKLKTIVSSTPSVPVVNLSLSYMAEFLELRNFCDLVHSLTEDYIIIKTKIAGPSSKCLPQNVASPLLRE